VSRDGEDVAEKQSPTLQRWLKGGGQRMLKSGINEANRENRAGGGYKQKGAQGSAVRASGRKTNDDVHLSQ